MQHKHTFPNQKIWRVFLARKVLLLKRGVLSEHSSAYRLAFLGQLIEETLARFAAVTLKRMDKDEAERAAFDAHAWTSSNFKWRWVVYCIWICLRHGMVGPPPV
jgi:hypothetical protein